MSLQDTNVEEKETQEQQVTNQGEQQVVEHVENNTPQNKEEPEFYLDKEGNLQWNTTEFDDKYPEDSEEDSDKSQQQQQEQQQQEQKEQQEQPKEKEEDNSEQETTEEEPKYKVKIGDEEIEVTQDELLRGYMRQQDYTRKTQALAEQRKQFEQIPPQYQQQYQQQIPQQQAQEQQQQVASNDDLMTMAKNIAAKQLGLESADDLSEIDFNHITAVVEAKQALINQRNQMMYRQQNIANLEQQLRQEEPKYDEIMQNMSTALQNLPVSRFNVLKDAYSKGNPEPLREFFKEVQKDYYSKAIQKVEQKKKPTVPVVEHSANTPVQPKPKNRTIDYKKFGHSTMDEKSKVLLELGLVD